MLEVQGLCKSFGGIHAVREIDFSVAKGQIFSLIGPNGAGKTTCFNLITGFYRPTSGKVTWDGEDVTALKPYDMASRGVIRTFQKTNVLRSLNVLDNVIHAHYLQERTPLWRTFWPHRGQSQRDRQIEDSSREIIEMMGLGHRMEADANALSCGELRLLEVSVALGAKPRLLMLDEPAAGLNTREANDLAKRLIQLPGKWVESLLLVEHNMHLVMQVSDHIVVMNFGQKLASGTPQEIQSNPAVLEAYMGKAA
ncbi:ABC transporter ATP-binding protein [Pusillimonas sp. CC-YST705]|uniref:ABC transporter ATP-binding protein n=1 Tax=Mesopusillimonas faecipullorum TaxID=2755040 RepID=A0ABS8CFA4_9BURK|nr:ABC transporter ATP-binding protein [Mesopusillimonas faecipullorum]MCB5364254.1 ABC transporter ATP-binding protein [Mesopusillimonas faecipullorum]